MNGTNDLKFAMSSGERLIGAMVFWTELADAKVDRAVWRTGVKACGLEDALVELPKPEASLYRAVGAANRCATGDVTTRTKAGYARLKGKDTDAVYGVLMRRDTADGRMSYIEEATVSVDRHQPEPAPVVVIDPNAPEDPLRDALVGRIVAEYVELRTFANTQEVSETLVRAVRDTCRGLTLRTGVYFVRPEFLTALAALQAFLAESCGAAIQLWEQRYTDRNAKAAQGTARASLSTAFAELKAEVDEFRALNPNPEAVVAKSVAVRVRRFKELDAKVELYADVLGDYASQLRDSIGAARREMLGAFLGADSEAA